MNFPFTSSDDDGEDGGGDAAQDTEDGLFDADPDTDPAVEKTDAEYTEDEIYGEPVDDEKFDPVDPPEAGVVDDLTELHRDFVAPSQLKQANSRTLLSGEQYIRNYYIDGWPSGARPGFLSPVFSDAALDTDISIHLKPRSSEQAERDLDEHMIDTEAELDNASGADMGRKRDLEKRFQEAQAMYDLVSQQGMRMFDVSMYVNFRVDSRFDPVDIDDAESDLVSMLVEPPANTDVRTSTNIQQEGVISTSPVGMDKLEKSQGMLAPPAAAMIPFTSSTLIEETGIDYGILTQNGSPVIADRFDRENGYNMVTIGDIGSGKSYSSKLQLVRTVMRRDDVEIVMLDPLGGFNGLNTALDGERKIVGGSDGLNPMQIEKTPQHVLDSMGDEAGSYDPLSEKIKDVMAFFDTFFKTQGVTDEVDKSVLEIAVQHAYEEEKGITHDIETHSKESPTITDVISVLKDMSENPSMFTNSIAKEEKTSLAEGAGDLQIALRPFLNGAYENLSKHTNINPVDSKVTYLDLRQGESSESGTALMMQLLFNLVYEKAKRSENKTLFMIDEARHLMKNTANVEFLEQAVRHSRHHDLGIHFISQTIEEFYESDATETIIDNCSMVQLNKLSDISADVAREKLGLNDNQIDFVRKAQAGNDNIGYSEALLKVGNEGWYPLRVKANEVEDMIVDFDPGKDDRVDLPGYDEENSTEELKQYIENKAERDAAKQQAAEESSSDDHGVSSFLIDNDYSELDLTPLGANRHQVYLGDIDSDNGDDITGAAPDNPTTPSELVQTPGEAQHMFHVRITTEDDFTSPGDDEIPVYPAFGDALTVYETDPAGLALRAGNYTDGFDALVGTSVAPATLAHSLYSVDGVDSVAVTDVSGTVGWSDIDQDFAPVEETGDDTTGSDTEDSEQESVDDSGFQSFE